MKIAYLTLLALAGLGGCGKVCTDMRAPDMLTFVFEPEVSASGTWAFDLSDGDEAYCEVVLPVPDPSNMTYTPCGGDDLTHLGIAEDGLDVEDLRIEEAAPESAVFTVSFEGSIMWSETITPKYAVDEPNGEGCGERYRATVSVEVPEP
jgi:hypothetical protein